MSETAVITLLFCDLVGSTELLTALGDDANDEVRRSLLSALAQEAGERGGTVVKSIGDGMMVSFRTSAADAVACAIAMQRAAIKVERDGAALGLELRVGISSGEAAYEDGDWFGTPVVEAARLEAAARPGQILVSEVVRSIVGNRGGARFRPAGKRELKGFARPVPVVEVVWRDDSTPRPVTRKAKRPIRTRLAVGAAGVLIASVALAAGLVFALRDSGRTPDTAASLPLVAEGYVPALEPWDCPAGLAADHPGVRCQYLVVPEDRSKPSGRQVRIPVLVAPSKAQQPGIPTVFLNLAFNGPGISIIEDVRAYGDAVMFGDRGEQFSQPALTCPEVASVQRQILGLATNGPEANKLWLDAAEQCGRRLASEGVDLNAYGQNDTVDDVRDLAIAMGWRQINIEACCRSRAVLAARYPGLVRSMVLVAPYPPDSPVQDDIIGYNSASQAYFAACHADAACKRAFPNIEQLQPAKYAQYQQKPVVITTADPTGGPDIRVMLDGDTNISALVIALEIQRALPVIASAVASANNSGDATGAAFLAETAGLDPADPFAFGRHISEYCEDEDQSVSRAGVEAAALAYPLFRAFAHDPWLQVCKRWPTQQRSEVIASAGHASTVPALILTGALNPYAPPDYAQRAAKAFTHATVAVFPSLTGYVLYSPPPCIAALRLDFLRNPKAKLDIDGCIAKVPPIAFIGTDSSGTTPTTVPTSAP